MSQMQPLLPHQEVQQHSDVFVNVPGVKSADRLLTVPTAREQFAVDAYRHFQAPNGPTEFAIDSMFAFEV